MKKVVVTGGAGFIGSHLCGKLLEEGCEVFCIDNMVTGSINNFDNFGNHKFFHFIEHDISVPMKEDIGPVDQIYNLACPASPVDYKELPLQTLWVNAAGVKNMLELAVKNDAAFLQASTSEVYGDPLENPQKETYFGNSNPIGERSCYNEGKRYAESLCVNYHKHFDFPLKIVRIFNTYGPQMRKHDGRVIPEFINRAFYNEPLLITGDGSQVRSFCYVDDMIAGLIRVMDSDKKYSSPVNIGNPEEISIKNLADLIVSLTRSSSTINFVENAPDDPMKRCPDITLARKEYGFSPSITLEDGLKKTISYFNTLN